MHEDGTGAKLRVGGNAGMVLRDELPGPGEFADISATRTISLRVKQGATIQLDR